MSEEMAKEVNAEERDLKAENAALMDENIDLARQNELLVKQHTGLEDRFNLEKARWKQYKADMLTENEALRQRNIALEQAEEKRRIGIAQERSRRIATVPKLVIIAAGALAALAIPYTLQVAGVIGPQLSYGIQCGLMMAISWCYALIWDRTRK